MNGREPDTGPLKERFWKGVDRWSKVATLLIVPILAWMFRVEMFMAPGARFTPQDAIILEQRVDRKIADTLIQGPEWLRADVVEMKSQVDANSLLLRDLNVKVVQMDERLQSIRELLSRDH